MVYSKLLYGNLEIENFERGFDVHYLNPIIFYRPVEFSKHSPDNALLGLNIDYNFNKINLYAQLLIDDLNINRYENTGDGFFQNKLAFQLGIKSQFSINEHKFNFLSEFNQAQAIYICVTSNAKLYSYEPSFSTSLGANFKENIVMFNYNLKNGL